MNQERNPEGRDFGPRQIPSIGTLHSLYSGRSAMMQSWVSLLPLGEGYLRA